MWAPFRSLSHWYLQFPSFVSVRSREFCDALASCAHCKTPIRTDVKNDGVPNIYRSSTVWSGEWYVRQSVASVHTKWSRGSRTDAKREISVKDGNRMSRRRFDSWHYNVSFRVVKEDEWEQLFSKALHQESFLLIIMIRVILEGSQVPA